MPRRQGLSSGGGYNWCDRATAPSELQSTCDYR
eukprot:CAMPEP_0204341042 /NCGR_PEP_ID=MMETSP0469-20131031/23047_1 /ASSEMBLY_ACC=CAM_ASM_000384 /TAXON_ID=2969 /ORGANISM="Oxyrrhis marina" /LENGTH=32 /DNA_ID= /DNA_START= /DNA_END= /DNA_ORIENTATION=